MVVFKISSRPTSRAGGQKRGESPLLGNQRLWHFRLFGFSRQYPLLPLMLTVGGIGQPEVVN